jgi:hypothetical protein
VKTNLIIALFLSGMLMLSGYANAQDKNDHSQHDQSKQEDHSGHNMHGADADVKFMGKMIRHTGIEGFMVMYHLLDQKERDDMTKAMKGMDMPGMDKTGKATNHLMIYIKGADGKMASGKIGFHIVGPDGKEQKTLTMGMYGGYGADVNFSAKGAYKIKTKAVIGDKTLQDEFSYEVK